MISLLLKEGKDQTFNHVLYLPLVVKENAREKMRYV